MRGNLFFDRLLANLYDLVFLGLLIIVTIIGIGILNEEYLDLGNTLYYIIGVSTILYIIFYLIMPLKTKATVGKLLTDLIVKPTQGKMTIGRWLFREFIFKQLLYLTIIGIIVELVFILFKKNTLHDYYLKTIVVKK